MRREGEPEQRGVEGVVGGGRGRGRGEEEAEREGRAGRAGEGGDEVREDVRRGVAGKAA